MIQNADYVYRSLAGISKRQPNSPKCKEICKTESEYDMKDAYVLVTAARNEEAYIEMTIKSVIAQTVLPQKWVIVSDGSTDRTDEIVKRYAAQYDFIELMRLEAKDERNFASQVYNQRAGVERLQNIKYGFIGVLDGDISVKPDYYERILRQFELNAKLGLAGGVLFDLLDGKWIRQRVNVSLNVSGPVQMFRRQCYDDIGGYLSLSKGGADAIAEVMARMHGWDVRSFPDIEVFHYRPTGSSCGGTLVRRFHFGVSEYMYGNHPLFEFTKCLYRIKQRPYLLGGIFRLCGYCWAFLQRKRREAPRDVIRYLQQEQLHRLYAVLSKWRIE
jgi:glycosyltransferase involved in cell wall biosynthesis